MMIVVCSVCLRKLAAIAVRRCASSRTVGDVSKIRNIGVLAHIDAGKTTVTERMLFYAGVTQSLGNVDAGNTVTDYLDLERRRGITVNSAAVSFPWADHTINLIDTPGHVDFTVEVERSLRVLDSAVVVLDGSRGVQAQTTTVWRQANNYSLPRVIFVNKLDKPNSDFARAVQSVATKLNAVPLVCNVPVGSGQHFSGVCDVVSMKKYLWGDDSELGAEYTECDISQEDEYFEPARKARESLILELADLNESLADLVLAPSFDVLSVPASFLAHLIRDTTLRTDCFPVVCGTALRNKGVQTLLDSVCHYLASPLDIAVNQTLCRPDQTCAFVFKVEAGRTRWPLLYTRIYSGSIKQGDVLKVVNSGSLDTVKQVYQPEADVMNRVTSASAGHIAVLTGLKHANSGDTLCHKGEDVGVLPGFTQPTPVVYSTVEADSASQDERLRAALHTITREDPSFTVADDEDGTTVIGGMGELHFEVICERLKTEYKLDVRLGTLQVHYKESISGEIQHMETLSTSVHGQHHSVTVSVHVKPLERVDSDAENRINLLLDESSAALEETLVDAVNLGAKDALQSGPLKGFPVSHVQVDVTTHIDGLPCSPAVVTAAVTQAVRAALLESHVCLMEPMMALELSVPDDIVWQVLDDIKYHDGQVLNSESADEYTTINALCPLSKVLTYSTQLRSMTHGRALLSMEFSRYGIMTPDQQAQALQKLYIR